MELSDVFEWKISFEDFIDKASLGQSVSGKVGKLHNITFEQPENGTITNL